MWNHQVLIMLGYLQHFLPLTTAAVAGAAAAAYPPPAIPSCKATLGSPDWPSAAKWASLNSSISGHLLKPPPPGAVCHSDQPTFNATTCPAVQAAWLTIDFHVENPVSNAWNNFNNDTCLPFFGTPCSDEGYPVYVVNATSKEHVKAGVDFARENNVRLIVKGTGHDYVGRSVAPNSLSIWTRHLQGITFHDGFTPAGCRFSIDTPAVTSMAGSLMEDINLQASLRNLTVLSAGELTVGLGGYYTGGGHAALSATYGLAADNILEMEIVTPGGEILTINECQNEDLFWAMRGGGGSTFGVIVSATIKAFPSTPFAVATAIFATEPDSDAFWNSIALMLSQFPSLSDQGIAGYTTISPVDVSTTPGEEGTFGVFEGLFILPLLSPSNTSDSITNAITTVMDNVSATYPNLLSIVNTTVYPSFYDWWIGNNGPHTAGADIILGSRLLDEKALTNNLTALREAVQIATPIGLLTQNSSNAYLVSGKGVRDVVPRGGSDAVLPAWRDSLVHFVTAVGWPSLDPPVQLEQENLMTNTYVEALRQLAPDTGAYVNEADFLEPNFQETFWGANYPRLLAIKRAVDPDDVLWCTPCVGNERLAVKGDALCRV